MHKATEQRVTFYVASKFKFGLYVYALSEQEPAIGMCNI